MVNKYNKYISSLLGNQKINYELKRQIKRP